MSKSQSSSSSSFCKDHFGTDLLCASWLFIISTVFYTVVICWEYAVSIIYDKGTELEVELLIQTIGSVLYLIGAFGFLYVSYPKNWKQLLSDIQHFEIKTASFTERYFTGNLLLISVWLFYLPSFGYYIFPIWGAISGSYSTTICVIAFILCAFINGMLFIWVFATFPENMQLNNGLGTTYLLDFCCCCCLEDIMIEGEGGGEGEGEGDTATTERRQSSSSSSSKHVNDSESTSLINRHTNIDKDEMESLTQSQSPQPQHHHHHHHQQQQQQQSHHEGVEEESYAIPNTSSTTENPHYNLNKTSHHHIIKLYFVNDYLFGLIIFTTVAIGGLFITLIEMIWNYTNPLYYCIFFSCLTFCIGMCLMIYASYPEHIELNDYGGSSLCYDVCCQWLNNCQSGFALVFNCCCFKLASVLHSKKFSSNNHMNGSNNNNENEKDSSSDDNSSHNNSDNDANTTNHTHTNNVYKRKKKQTHSTNGNDTNGVPQETTHLLAADST